jgi:ABC-type sugar transport system permease subunit
MLAPTLVFLFLFTYGPALYNVIQSGPGYSKLWTNPSNLASLRATLLYVLIAAPASILLGLGAALLVEGKTPARIFARAVLFHPVVLPAVALSAGPGLHGARVRRLQPPCPSRLCLPLSGSFAGRS